MTFDMSVSSSDFRYIGTGGCNHGHSVALK